MNELKVFENPAFGQVRTVTVGGEPWFVGRDVAASLGYGDSGKSATNAVARHVDSEDKGVTEIVTPGGVQKTTIINESGLYSLMLSSKLPQAKEFKRWVTAEILPTIRKTGGYIAGAEAMTDAEIMAKALMVAQRTIEENQKRLEEERTKRLLLEETVENQKPAVLFAGAVSCSDHDILIGEMAKILKQNGYPTGQNRLFEQLRKDGYLISRKGTDYNMPTQRSMEMKLFRIKETAITHADGHVSVNKTPKVTGKGQIYFVNHYCKEDVV